MSKTIGIREAAKILGVKRQMVHYFIKKGDLKATIKGFGGYRFYYLSLDDVERYAKGRDAK